MQTIPPGLLEEITRRLVAEFHPDQIILFGSHAWGQPTPDSDIDILVVVPELSAPATREMTRAYNCLHEIHTVPIDIIVKTRERFARFSPVVASLEHKIMHEGRVLYG